jgi:hypothetical protein
MATIWYVDLQETEAPDQAKERAGQLARELRQQVPALAHEQIYWFAHHRGIMLQPPGDAVRARLPSELHGFRLQPDGFDPTATDTRPGWILDG